MCSSDLGNNRAALFCRNRSSCLGEDDRAARSSLKFSLPFGSFSIGGWLGGFLGCGLLGSHFLLLGRWLLDRRFSEGNLWFGRRLLARSIIQGDDLCRGFWVLRVYRRLFLRRRGAGRASVEDLLLRGRRICGRSAWPTLRLGGASFGQFGGGSARRAGCWRAELPWFGTHRGGVRRGNSSLRGFGLGRRSIGA